MTTTVKTIPSRYNYEHASQWLKAKGQEKYGTQFRLQEEDTSIIYLLLCYFLKDEIAAQYLGINLSKGILLTGPAGCGKTTLLNLMRYISQQAFVMKSCRDISFEFIHDGYEIIYRYSRASLQPHAPHTFCFDDLGMENNIKYYGNDCNVMAEILLTRYDLFITNNITTHLTTNLSAGEIEQAYGTRVRSRCREMFNLIAFDNNTPDKRR